MRDIATVLEAVGFTGAALAWIRALSYALIVAISAGACMLVLALLVAAVGHRD